MFLAKNIQLIKCEVKYICFIFIHKIFSKFMLEIRINILLVNLVLIPFQQEECMEDEEDWDEDEVLNFGEDTSVLDQTQMEGYLSIKGSWYTGDIVFINLLSASRHYFLESNLPFQCYLNFSVYFWSLDEVVGDLRNHVRPFVRSFVRMSRSFSKTVHYFFLKLCS